jgi:hypothetical protein
VIRFLLGMVAGLVTGILLFGSLLEQFEDAAD